MENNNEKIENQQGEAAKKTNILTDIVEIIESTLVTVFIIVLVFTYVLHPVNIVGHSMVPTLNKDYDPSLGNTDKIFMSTVFFDVDYGDILVINKDVNYLLDDNGNPIKHIPRHPILEDNVIVYSNATILGRVTIGKGAVIGGNIWVTYDVPAGARISQRKHTTEK